MSVRNGDRIHCAICNGVFIFHERYPNAICSEHYDECFDAEKNRVFHTNKDEFGGFVSNHMIGNRITKKEDHVCFVRGKECYADESRFGGIVIQMK